MIRFKMGEEVILEFEASSHTLTRRGKISKIHVYPTNKYPLYRVMIRNAYEVSAKDGLQFCKYVGIQSLWRIYKSEEIND